MNSTIFNLNNPITVKVTQALRERVGDKSTDDNEIDEIFHTYSKQIMPQEGEEEG